MLNKTKRIIAWTVIFLPTIILLIIGVFFFNNPTINNIISKNNEQLVLENIKKFNQIKLVYVIISASLIIFSTVVAVLLAQSIQKPIDKLIKSAEMIIKSENTGAKYLKNNANKNQIDILVEGFAGINANLKEKLNDVIRKKQEVETVLRYMTDGVIYFNIKGEITYINPMAELFLNINTHEKENFETIFKKLNIEFNMEKILFMEKENWASQTKIVELQDKNYKIYFTPLKDDRDVAEGMIVLIQDITENIKLDKMRKTFVADVSHELKTPITSILGYIEILLDRERPVDEERGYRFKERILSETKRMSELVSDLLILSRYDSSVMLPKKEKFQITDIMKERVENFQDEALEKKVTLKSFITSEIPEVYADQKGIDRVITNLISNAIKYNEEGGEVNVYAGYISNNVYIKIKDTGIGIKEEDLNKIFDRFYRVDSSRVRLTGGSGLGLSIVKEIVEQNGGIIDVNSKFGEGTEFVLRLPIKQK